MSELTLRFDGTSATTLYVGEAATSVSESAAFWRVKRITITGSNIDIKWADGNEEFDNVWANRASLSYL